MRGDELKPSERDAYLEVLSSLDTVLGVMAKNLECAQSVVTDLGADVAS